MKKIVLLLVITTLLIFSTTACRQQPSPEPPQQQEEYAYGELEARDIKSLEITAEYIKTPAIEEKATIDKVADYISAAKFVEVANDPSRVEIAERGMRVYLKEELNGSDFIVVTYRESDGDRLYLGPQGHEYLIESRGLADFIKDNLKGKVLIIEEEILPEEIKEWFDSFENEKGAYVYQHPDDTYIRVNAGEKPTGGFSLNYSEFTEKEYPNEILVELQEPKEGELVTEALTYPYLILKINSEEVTKYEVKTVGGQDFKVEEKIVFSKIDELKEGDTITSPLRLKGKIVAFEGAFGIRILDGNDKEVHVENLQADAGGPAWGNFDAEFTFPVPNTENGYLELGEYSAKDGSWVVRERIEVKFKK